MPENRQALERKRAVASTVKSSASLAWFDPDTCSLRTSQQSLLTDSEPSSLTLPRSGMTRNGYVYELPIVGRITCEIVGGYWPTPMKSDGLVPFGYQTMLRKENGEKRPSGAQIGTQLTWDRRALPWVVGGRINPILTEWMMGFPIGWTALNVQEMGKSHCKPQPLGDCLEAND